jgi:uncharacterized 2Fe-2S/4Fe-4S cluster protein (DUF4445 family)
MKVIFRWRHHVRGMPAEAEATLAELARQIHLPLNMVCEGRGRCGRCAVVLEQGSVRVGARIIQADPYPVTVLACQAYPLGNDELVVRVPERSLRETRPSALTDFHGWRPRWQPALRVIQCRETATPTTSLVEHWAHSVRQHTHALVVDLPELRSVPDPEQLEADLAVVEVSNLSWVVGVRPAGGVPRPLGLAIDVGTTTVVVALVDLTDGRVLGRASDYNAQIARGADVASRITASERPDGLSDLQELVVRHTLNPLIQRVCDQAKVTPTDILHVVAAGNTVMEHLFLGLPPSGIGRLPFRPLVRWPWPVRARALGLHVAPSAVVELVPALSAHVGGDLTADAVASRLIHRKGVYLLVDIGTNGELLLWDGKRLRGCAAAAGPAFEGHGVTHGMRATEGAIDHIWFEPNGTLTWSVLGTSAPAGFCGSALVDMLAEMYRAGWIDSAGRFREDRWDPAGRRCQVPIGSHPVAGCILVPAEHTAHHEPLVISEADIAELLKAKAAIQAGWTTLLRQAGISVERLDGLILAGAFAHHIHLQNAIQIGLLPPVPSDRITVLGNGSLAGAYLALGSRGVRRDWRRLLDLIEPVELNRCEGFEDTYVAALFLGDS